MYLFNRTTDYRHFVPCWWLVIALSSCHTASAFHLILDPAGDAKNPGRQLATCAERSVTLQLCEMLKEAIIKQIPSCTVTITRTAGETRTQEQRAQIANQLEADLFIHISACNDSALRPDLRCYYLAPASAAVTISSPYTLIPVHKAHEQAVKQTERFIRTLHHTLSTTTLYTVQPPAAIPDARLIGITIPACTLEFGVTVDIPWTALIEPLSMAIIECIEDQ